MYAEELCLKATALFVHGDLTSKEFTDILFANTELFTDIIFDNMGKEIFGEDLYYDIIDTNFDIKEQRVSIKTKLANFLKERYPSIYNSVSDSYIEKIVEENNDDILTKILAERYIQSELAVIDFSGVDSSENFIIKIRDALGFPMSCTNWNGVYDMIYDVMFPKKIIFRNYGDVINTLPGDFAILKEILDKKRDIGTNEFTAEYK